MKRSRHPCSLGGSPPAAMDLLPSGQRPEAKGPRRAGRTPAPRPGRAAPSQPRGPPARQGEAGRPRQTQPPPRLQRDPGGWGSDQATLLTSPPDASRPLPPSLGQGYSPWRTWRRLLRRGDRRWRLRRGRSAVPGPLSSESHFRLPASFLSRDGGGPWHGSLRPGGRTIPARRKDSDRFRLAPRPRCLLPDQPHRRAAAEEGACAERVRRPLGRRAHVRLRLARPRQAALRTRHPARLPVCSEPLRLAASAGGRLDERPGAPLLPPHTRPL